jgi:hypothetical protein
MKDDNIPIQAKRKKKYENIQIQDEKLQIKFKKIVYA